VVIDVPAPRPGDSDQLVSSLENAALFGRIGDNEEALRWLQRAAEFASESGDDLRTLALARSAAELSGSIRAGLTPVSTKVDLKAEKPLPAPPPRSRPAEPEATPADASTQDEPTLLVARPQPHAPPPPSARPLASRPHPQHASARNLPAPTGARTPDPPATKSVVAKPTAAAPAKPTAAAPAKPTAAAPAATATPQAVSSQVTTPKSPPTAPKSSPTAATSPPRLRQAARVSVEKSASEPGLFLVRLLEDGKAPPPGRSEALLLELDPSSRLF
jgi:hypothetical protein